MKEGSGFVDGQASLSPGYAQPLAKGEVFPPRLAKFFQYGSTQGRASFDEVTDFRLWVRHMAVKWSWKVMCAAVGQRLMGWA